jgi:hypothetical protein
MIILETSFWDPPWQVITFIANLIWWVIKIAFFIALVYGIFYVGYRIVLFIIKLILILSPLWLGGLSIYWGHAFNWWYFWIFFPISVLIGYGIVHWIHEDGTDAVGAWLTKGISEE